MYKADNTLEEGDLDAFATTVNQRLREGVELEGEWLETSQALKNLISQSHSSEPKILFRGTSLNYVNRWKRNGHIIDPAFLSTTLWRQTAGKFLFPTKHDIPAIIEIHCHEETAMLSMDLDPTFGASEYEYLLLPMSKLQIISERSVGDQSLIDFIAGSQTGLQSPIKEIMYFETLILR
jgi:hypothetical protein